MANEYGLPPMGGATISKKIMVELIRELRHGRYSECDKLPSELELCEDFKVSRSVIRDVLSGLEREGFVERGRGIGTRIHRDIVNLENRFDLKYEYYDLVRGMGCLPSCDSVRLYTATADQHIAKKLEIKVGEPLVVCEKRILASGKPVIYSIDHLPAALFSHKKYQDFNWHESVFDMLEQEYGIDVDTDIARISAVSADEHIAEKLLVQPGAALLFLDEVGYYKLSRPIIHTHAYYTNFFDFTMLRRRF